MKRFVFPLLVCAVVFSACSKDFQEEPDRPTITFEYEIPEPEVIPYEYAGGQGDHTSYNPDNKVKFSPALANAGLYIAEQALGVATSETLKVFRHFGGV